MGDQTDGGGGWVRLTDKILLFVTSMIAAPWLVLHMYTERNFPIIYFNSGHPPPPEKETQNVEQTPG